MVFGLDGAPLAHAFHPLGSAAAGSCKPSQAAGLQEFLGAVRRRFGVVLFAAQLGETPPYANPPKGFGGADVLELINTVERTIRPIKPGHENHLFAGSDGGAESSNSPPIVELQLRIDPAARPTSPDSFRSLAGTRRSAIRPRLSHGSSPWAEGPRAGLYANAILDPSSTMLSGSTCRSTARGEPVQNRPRRVDRTKCSVSQIKPARRRTLGGMISECRTPGKLECHQIGILWRLRRDRQASILRRLG